MKNILQLDITGPHGQLENISEKTSEALDRHSNKWLCRSSPGDNLEGRGRLISICDKLSFSNRKLLYAGFELAVMAGVDFSNSDISYANFNGADLRCADFRGATVIQTFFAGASLQGANFTGVDLSRAGGISNTDGILFDAPNEIRCYRAEEFMPEFPHSASMPAYEEPNIGAELEYLDDLHGNNLLLRCLRHKEYSENLTCALEALSHLTGLSVGDLRKVKMHITLRAKVY